ncbi:hypothetical protein BDF22DRAFT_689482 [Syncephalis plumigaleata]|nr:hypothetical protein BDF22DRAFT_689482 [Syncephalis plumigaleata]
MQLHSTLAFLAAAMMAMVVTNGVDSIVVPLGQQSAQPVAPGQRPGSPMSLGQRIAQIVTPGHSTQSKGKIDCAAIMSGELMPRDPLDDLRQTTVMEPWMNDGTGNICSTIGKFRGNPNPVAITCFAKLEDYNRHYADTLKSEVRIKCLFVTTKYNINKQRI